MYFSVVLRSYNKARALLRFTCRTSGARFHKGGVAPLHCTYTVHKTLHLGTMMSATRPTEALLDHFRRLDEKEQTDHIISLLHIVEVSSRVMCNLPLNRAADPVIHCLGASAPQSLQQDSSVTLLWLGVSVTSRAIHNGDVLPRCPAAVCRCTMLPQLEKHG